MAGASSYTRDNVINALLRGVAFPLPTFTYVSMHTADPGLNGANEVTTGAMPAYARQKAEGAGALGSGWSASSAGSTSNAKQIIFPSNNGAGSITVTHFAVWDAATTGNCLCKGVLATSRTLAIGDVYVNDIGSLVVTQS